MSSSTDTRVLMITYKGRIASGATAANLCSLFRGRKLVGYALPEMPLSVGSKLKLLSELCLCQTSVYCPVCIRTNTGQCMYIAPRVMYSSAFM